MSKILPISIFLFIILCSFGYAQETVNDDVYTDENGTRYVLSQPSVGLDPETVVRFMNEQVENVVEEKIKNFSCQTEDSKNILDFLPVVNFFLVIILFFIILRKREKREAKNE